MFIVLEDHSDSQLVSSNSQQY